MSLPLVIEGSSRSCGAWLRKTIISRSFNSSIGIIFARKLFFNKHEICQIQFNHTSKYMFINEHIPFRMLIIFYKNTLSPSWAQLLIFMWWVTNINSWTLCRKWHSSGFLLLHNSHGIKVTNFVGLWLSKQRVVKSALLQRKIRRLASFFSLHYFVVKCVDQLIVYQYIFFHIIL